jgi:hypothetical protein
VREVSDWAGRGDVRAVDGQHGALGVQLLGEDGEDAVELRGRVAVGELIGVSEWSQRHGPCWPLWGRLRRDVSGGATVVARVGSFVFAAYYTGLDAVAGMSAGTVTDHGATSAVGPLFTRGDALGHTGVYALAVAALATCAVPFLRHGARVLPGGVILLAACWSFYDSHIFRPKGVFTMLGYTVAFGLPARAASADTPSAA